ncbi:hypothetical protein GCM10009757_44260 [Streptomyces cheonanensis]|uniref:Uncharacterized protein n=1 Tax=Streptomyces cheonanensis TaxID=312720 RepID=A0ABN2VFL7_9ACTN
MHGDKPRWTADLHDHVAGAKTFPPPASPAARTPEPAASASSPACSLHGSTCPTAHPPGGAKTVKRNLQGRPLLSKPRVRKGVGVRAITGAGARPGLGGSPLT